MIKVKIKVEAPKGVKVVTNDGSFVTLLNIEEGHYYLFTCLSDNIRSYNLMDSANWKEYTKDELGKILKLTK